MMAPKRPHSAAADGRRGGGGRGNGVDASDSLTVKLKAIGAGAVSTDWVYRAVIVTWSCRIGSPSCHKSGYCMFTPKAMVANEAKRYRAYRAVIAMVVMV